LQGILINITFRFKICLLIDIIRKMEKKIKIAFDLDGVIIDKPPLIPKKLLEKLFRGSKKNGLHYRFPKSKREQTLRKISHYYLLRPPISKNIDFIKKLSRDKRYDLYIISARYSFLKKQTDNWIAKRGLNKIFKKICLNSKDEQPHLFKEKVLTAIKPAIYIDDDNLLADYLVNKGKTKIICFSKDATCEKAVRIIDLSAVEGILKEF